MKLNTIIHGDALTELKKFDDACIDMCVTSPPYWGLRDYGESVNAIWDDDGNCKHKWGKKIPANTNNNRWHTFGDYRYDGGAGKRKIGTKNATHGNFCSLCGAWRGQLGLEPTFELYIKHLCDIFDGVKRVLKNTGSCWVNIGDTYWGGGQGGADYGGKETTPESAYGKIATGNQYPSKSLCDIPYRFSIEMVNRGWIKRNTIIWEKSNCMPSSAKDRFTVDFEYLFFFVKSSDTQYWVHTRKLLAVNQKPKADYRWQHATGYELKKPPKEKDWDRKRIICPDCKGTGRVTLIEDLPLFGLTELGEVDCKRCYESTQNKDVENYTIKEWQKINLWEGKDYYFEQQFDPHTSTRWGGTNDSACKDGGYAMPNYKPGTRSHKNDYPVEGRNKRCVWQIPTQPYSEAHFAVFPEALIETPIQAGCPQYICKKCGVAREKIFDVSYRNDTTTDGRPAKGNDTKGRKEAGCMAFASGMRTRKIVKELGYTDCGCNAGFRPGILLDPFMGAGTSGVVARKLGRDFIGIELQKKYIPMAHKRKMAVPESLFKES